MSRFMSVLMGVCAGALFVVGAGCRSSEQAMDVPAGFTNGVHEVSPNGARLWYRVAGNTQPGEAPVVFLHGGPGQGSAHFDALAGPFLEPTLRMVYYDQRGSGHSERPASNDYSTATLVEDIEGLRVALGAPKIALIGHSFGGMLALEYAARYPEHVSAVVHVAGVWDMPIQCTHRLEYFAAKRPELYHRARVDSLRADGTPKSNCEYEFGGFESQEHREVFVLEQMFPDPAVNARIDSVNNAHRIENTGEMGNYQFNHGLLDYRFEGFSRLTMPVLVIGGRHDGAVPPAGLKELAGRLPNARYLEFANSGHFVYLDEPERFAREVAGFLKTSR